MCAQLTRQIQLMPPVLARKLLPAIGETGSDNCYRGSLLPRLKGASNNCTFLTIWQGTWD
jgi:hypothetical protein